MGEPVTKKKISPWVWGCGIGCAGLLALMAFGAIAAYVVFTKYYMPKMKEGLAREFPAQYERAKNDGKLSPEQQEVFGDLLNLCKPSEASIIAMGAAFMLFETAMNAAEPDRQEALNAAKDLRDAMKANPNLGVGDIRRLLQKYPKIGQAIQKGMNDFSRMKQKESEDKPGK